MALPAGVTTATVIAGVPVTHTGAAVKAFVSIEPSAYLVHAATGTPLVDFIEELDISEGTAGQFILPHTDQAGFIDGSGAAYTNWYYTARVTYSTPSKAKTKAPKVKVFQLTTGQTTIDLDLLPEGAPALPYIAPTAKVDAFMGRTGAIILEETDLPERLSETELSATYAPRFGRAFAGLKQSLADLRHCAVAGQGDSTGNEPSEWVYLLAAAIGTDNPTYTVRHWLWNDTTQRYDRPTSIQTGAAGRANVTPGGVSPAWYGPVMGNDLDVRINLKDVDWSNGAVQTLVARQGASGSYGFKFGLNSTGLMTLTWSSDGTTFNATKFGNAVPFADNVEGWLRVVLDADNGAAGHDVKFYQSADGETWAQVGSTITTAGVTTVYQPSAWPFEFGSRNLGGEPLTAGSQVYEVQVRDGIDGPLLCPPNVAAWLLPSVSGGGFTGTINGAPVLDVFNGSKPGAGLSYLNDATRLPKMLPLVAPLAVFLSNSHNENHLSGPPFITAYKAWVDAVKARHVGVPVVAMTQNPEQSPAVYWKAQAKRRPEIMATAAATGIDVIDTYAAFTGDITLLLEADGLHPNAAGSIVWADTVKAAYDAA